MTNVISGDLSGAWLVDPETNVELGTREWSARVCLTRKVPQCPRQWIESFDGSVGH